MLDKLQAQNRQVCQLLQESHDLERARRALFDYLKDLEWQHRQNRTALNELERTTALQALHVFCNLLSPHYEKLAGFSTLNYLWQFVNGTTPLDDTPSPGFVKEFEHLFKAISGQSGLSTGWLGAALVNEGAEPLSFAAIAGQAGGVARSNFLDRVSARMMSLVNSYPTGLDPELIAEREKNRQKILDFFGATLEQWYSTTWQVAHILKGRRGLECLRQLVLLRDEEAKAIRLCVTHDLPFGITPYYLSLFDLHSAERKVDAQIRSQVIPPLYYVERLIEHRADRLYQFDFMAERATSPIPLVTRRYASIVILKPFNTCPQICVYCQRNWELDGPMAPGARAAKDKLDRALTWLADHAAVQDIIITGGDPLFLSDETIEYLMERLCQIEHIVHIRWASRAPVTMPMRITERLAEMLGRYIEPGRRSLCLTTHIESAAEITPDLVAAAARLRRQGISVYNQQVMVRETSRRFQSVTNRIALKRAGIDPYYTFCPKKKGEMKDYLTPVARIAQEIREEARLLPGMFRTDEPVFNVSRLGKNYIRAGQDRDLIAIRPDGCRVYLWHPWEKGITPMDPWPCADTSIYDYLQWIESVGEDPREYETIWYYY